MAITSGLCTSARLPVYAERSRVDLGRLKVTVNQPAGMILYLKGRFLPADAPGLEEQLALDRKLLQEGLVDDEGRGPRYAELQATMLERTSKAG